MKKALSSVLVLILVCGLLWGTVGCGGKKTDGDFQAPAEYATVLQVIINPTVNLYLDANDVVLAVEYVNTDAKDAYRDVETQLVGAALTQAVDLVVKTAIDKGYLTDKNEVTLNVVEGDGAADVLDTAVGGLTKYVAELTINRQVQGEAVTGSDDTTASTADGTTASTAADTTTSATTSATTTTTVTTTTTTTKATTTTTTKAPVVKDPTKDLKKDTDYCVYLTNGNHLTVNAIRFQNDGTVSFSNMAYSATKPEWDGAETIQVNGKTWYNVGGLGDGGVPYTLTSEAITVAGENGTMVLTMNADGSLTVKENTLWADYFKVGNILKADKQYL